MDELYAEWFQMILGRDFLAGRMEATSESRIITRRFILYDMLLLHDKTVLTFVFEIRSSNKLPDTAPLLSFDPFSNGLQRGPVDYGKHHCAHLKLC